MSANNRQYLKKELQIVLSQLTKHIENKHYWAVGRIAAQGQEIAHSLQNKRMEGLFFQIFNDAIYLAVN